MSETTQTVLGFDFGTSRIGVAVGQSLTGTAAPLEPVAARDGIPDWQIFDQLIAEWQPTALVVGIPSIWIPPSATWPAGPVNSPTA